MQMHRVTIAVALINAGLLQPVAARADGAAVFKSNCAACHGNEGQGTRGLAPALKGDKFVLGKKDDVLTIVRNGRNGDQKKYKDLPLAMPAWSGKLSDAEIAAVVDYVRGDLQTHK